MTPATQSRLNGMQVAIVVLTFATGLIHLWKGLSDGLLMFIANGLGYFALATVAYLPIAALARYRRLAKWALLVFIAITIIGWVLIGERSAIGFTDKAIEVVLIVLVYLDVRKQP
jgi:uncharacterized membrane protein YgdD (TMEM256/DUF423 family)